MSIDVASVTAEELARRHDAEELVRAVEKQLRHERQRRLAFYDWLDEDRKAEFIDGEVVVHSPVVKRHADVSKRLTVLLDLFASRPPIGWVATKKVLVQLKRDDFEPDVAFWKAERAAAFAEDQLFFPAPDFVVEVLSPSTARYDRNEKFVSYAANGVPEYWIVDAAKREVECYDLAEDGTYSLRERVAESGRVRSEVVDGFEIPARALFEETAKYDAIAAVFASQRSS